MSYGVGEAVVGMEKTDNHNQQEEGPLRSYSREGQDTAL